MGYSNWSSAAYSKLRDNYSTKSKSQIFSATMVDPDMDPKGLTFRESRDSDAHPNSLPVMVFLDVTGSMGRIPEILVREKLGALMDTLIAHGVADPQILFGAIGDQVTDRGPLQVGQFESGTDELDMWLTKLWLEGGGGGQAMESYLLAWLIGGRHTSIDSFEKRGEKGFLFTIGDEWTWESLKPAQLREIMGYKNSSKVKAEDLLEEAKRMYEVFHIHINEACYRDDPRVIDPWKDLLGERLIILEDYNAIAETIAATVAVIRGANLKDVTRSFNSKTSKSVSNALVNVSNTVGLPAGSDEGIFKL